MPHPHTPSLPARLVAHLPGPLGPWLSRHVDRLEIGLLISLCLIGGGVWAFAQIASEMTAGDTTAFDRAVLLWFRDSNDLAVLKGPHWMETVVRDVTALGGVTVLGSLIVFTTGYLLMEGYRRQVWVLLAAVLGGQVVSNVSKLLFDRARPDVVPHGTDVTSASFPSGHSMMATITWLTLAVMLARLQSRRRTRAYLISVAVLISISVGISRLALGVHWPTDVLAGWSIGAAWALTCMLVADWFFPTRPAPDLPPQD
ncbi:phosphatase PAP2 family protein [Thioclava sp. GXIMD4216]|uniref:Phosphatase PAP2 family protein n=1 Tax=Thioclava litoralis TaxID=3076557 RepID=A0ABZ1DVF4_9RHOB|nr:phosphatase PAP2 family protein [Thioclava sp. FTW29]